MRAVKKTLLVQVASVINNLIFSNNIACYFLYVIATQCTIGSEQISKSEFLCLYM